MPSKRPQLNMRVPDETLQLLARLQELLAEKRSLPNPSQVDAVHFALAEAVERLEAEKRPRKRKGE